MFKKDLDLILKEQFGLIPSNIYDKAVKEAAINQIIELVRKEVIGEINKKVKENIEKSNQEVLSLEDHDERRVVGKHYRFMLGKHAAFNEFSQIIKEQLERVIK